MKWFFAILAVVAGVAIGYFLSRSKKRHAKNLEDINTTCNIISQNLGFTRDKLCTMLKNAEKTIDKDMKSVMTTLTANLNDDETALIEKISVQCRKIGLSTEESAIVSKVFASLGRSDAETQKKILENGCEELSGFRKRADEDYRKNSKLYLELGALLGIGVGILII